MGRIVEGQVVEVVDGTHGSSALSRSGESEDLPAQGSGASRGKKQESTVANHEGDGLAEGLPKLLYYTYSMSGVTYETAQDITGLEEQLHLDRVAAGQTASVKYDPSNPSNSILVADDWSGIH